jgi:uncharacterized protein YodC (DUF2158 family)
MSLDNSCPKCSLSVWNTGDVIRVKGGGPIGDIVGGLDEVGRAGWFEVRWRHSDILGYLWEKDADSYEVLKEESPPIVGDTMQIGLSTWRLTDAGWKCG